MFFDKAVDLVWEVVLFEERDGEMERIPVRSGYATYEEAAEVADTLSEDPEFEEEILYVYHMYRDLTFKVDKKC